MNSKHRPCTTRKLMGFSNFLVYLVRVIYVIVFPQFLVFLEGARFSLYNFLTLPTSGGMLLLFGYVHLNTSFPSPALLVFLLKTITCHDLCLFVLLKEN